MGLDAILEAIQKAGEAEINTIDLEQQRTTAEILSRALENSQRIEKREHEEALQSAREKEALNLQEAGLQAARIKDKALNQYLQTLWQETEKRLSALRQEADYPVLLENLLSELLSEFRQASVQNNILVIQADPRDREILQDICSKLGIDADIQFNLHTWGGLVLRNSGGSLRLDNTLETRLEYARESLNSLFLKNIYHGG